MEAPVRSTHRFSKMTGFSLNLKSYKPAAVVNAKLIYVQQGLKPASVTVNPKLCLHSVYFPTIRADSKYLCWLADNCLLVCILFTREKSETRWDISQPTLCSGFAPVNGCGRSPQVSTATETKARWPWKRIRWLLQNAPFLKKKKKSHAYTDSWGHIYFNCMQILAETVKSQRTWCWWLTAQLSLTFTERYFPSSLCRSVWGKMRRLTASSGWAAGRREAWSLWSVCWRYDGSALLLDPQFLTTWRRNTQESSTSTSLTSNHHISTPTKKKKSGYKRVGDKPTVSLLAAKRQKFSLEGASLEVLCSPSSTASFRELWRKLTRDM